jgi:hypothetical protein
LLAAAGRYPEKGDHPVLLAPFCERLGINADTQRKNLARVAWTCPVIMTVQIPGDDQARRLACIPLRTPAGWLFTINPAKVAPEAHPTLVAYQREAADVPHRHFLAPPSTPPARRRGDSAPWGARRVHYRVHHRAQRLGLARPRLDLGHLRHGDWIAPPHGKPPKKRRKMAFFVVFVAHDDFTSPAGCHTAEGGASRGDAARPRACASLRTSARKTSVAAMRRGVSEDALGFQAGPLIVHKGIQRGLVIVGEAHPHHVLSGSLSA